MKKQVPIRYPLRHGGQVIYICDEDYVSYNELEPVKVVFDPHPINDHEPPWLDIDGGIRNSAGASLHSIDEAKAIQAKLGLALEVAEKGWDGVMGIPTWNDLNPHDLDVEVARREEAQKTKPLDSADNP